MLHPDIAKVFRHGDLLLVKIAKLPTKLKQTTTKVILSGSHGHEHTFDNGKLYLSKVNEYTFGYFVAKDTKLFHSEHSKNGIAIPNGFYELRKPLEFINENLRPVID